MFETFYPSEWLESAYDVDYEAMYQKGYRNIIFDIDNTLVFHGAPQDERSLKLLSRLKELGFSVLFLSNNREERVKTFAEPVGALYIHKAGKPGKKGYFNAVEKLGGTFDNTFFVGDQLFTDVWGAKRAGLYNILVKPLNKKEEIQIVLKRILEKIVLKHYKKFLLKNVKE
ncbi:MAG: YqeG family HAD IIIA-type phosphatase [Lachnospiraceae bacterium]|nr:YqeG family HAD IIIA-type phosphatase [Lachnospiraceae bacterium]